MVTIAPTGLPIEDVVGRVRSALADEGRLVLQAEPGAGKTTVVPLRLLDEPWVGDGTILMLEPRRLATRAAATRMADLLGEPVGQTVGYRTRVDRAVSKATRIEVVTEGILTRRLQSDPSLAGIAAVIFDEFHERSLQSDLGLALTLEAAEALRPDLRIVVMSATIDTAMVARAIGVDSPAPVIEAPGRTHPIEIEWAPRNARDHLEPAVVATVDRALRRHRGDVLVFLPGAAAIRRVSEGLGRLGLDGVDVRPLFGGLSPAEQDAAIAPSRDGRRRVVVATDIAETSLTVDGVRIVVDSGLRRELRHDARSGMARLVTTSISRASADQRAGRAGRTEPGVAIRMWSKMEQATRPGFAKPEIVVGDIAGFVLEAAAWGSAIDDLTLLDRPADAALDAARELLAMLGGLDAEGRITPKGRRMADLPIHPRLGSMIVDAADVGDGALGCTLAAIVDARDLIGGRPDEVEVDVTTRVRLVVDRNARHPRARGGAVRDVRSTAADLARRAKVGRDEPVRLDRVGRVLASAYPDRVAQRRSGRGRFLLRSGTGAWLADTDVLASEPYLVAADLDGDRREARIRLAAGLDASDLEQVFDGAIDVRVVAGWDDERGDLVRRIERRLGSIRLASTTEPLTPGPATVDAIVAHLERNGLDALPWTPALRRLQSRVALVRTVRADWPALDDASLIADLDDWLAPLLAGATGLRWLGRVDLRAALLGRLGWHRERELDELVPARFELPSGRSVAIDYDREEPTVRGRVQDFFGSSATPSILDGARPLLVELLSPADRPVQVTNDLGAFWTGSWLEVRKDMAGRYPKHRWPLDPREERPGR